jgi:tRNA threonylcarbamoyladenosine biosynthesis protein TsaB
VIVLSIDTCDFRGSVAALSEQTVLGLAAHETREDYSSWLLRTVQNVLKGVALSLKDVDAYAVAAGPGSFTGVRVGLTTVKAWAEVYKKPVAAVSRLEAIAAQAAGGESYLGAFADAQRGQVFGAVYRAKDGTLTRVGEEMVIAPQKFVEAAAELCGGERISWVSTDPAHVAATAAWKDREIRGERIQEVSATLAAIIGRIGLRQWKEGKATDALGLDANYVRRSDAEIFWKGGAAHGH